MVRLSSIKQWSAVIVVVAAFFVVCPVAAQERVATKPMAVANPHPLDPVLKIAQEGLDRVRTEVKDYSAVLIRRERIKGKLGEYIYMDVKIRNRVVTDGKTEVPFAVILNFLKPASLKGREVVWVEGKNNGKMWVQESPLLGLKIPPVWLLPTGSLAMAENKYPITDIGLENLLVKLMDKGTIDRNRNRPEDCEVKILKGAKIEDRACTMITLRHIVQKPEYEFERAEIFMDDELKVPIRYAAFLFPETKGGETPLDEEYTYTKLNLNIGLTDKDFTR